MNTKLKTIVLVAVLALQANTAGAWGKIVFDPTNYKVNQIAVKSAVNSEVEAVTQTLHQFRQLYTMYQQLKQLNPAAYTKMAADAAEDEANLKSYLSATKSVSVALDGQDDFMVALQRNYIHEGEGDFKDYMNVLARRAVAGNLQARQLFDLATKTGEAVERTSQRRMSLQKQNEKNEGLMQAAQTTNQYLDVMVSQNQSIQVLLSEQVKALAEEKAKKAALDQSASSKISDQQPREKESLDTFSERWKFKKH